MCSFVVIQLVVNVLLRSAKTYVKFLLVISPTLYISLCNICFELTQERQL